MPGGARKVARRWIGRLLDALVPCHCLHCFQTEPGSMPIGLCARCRELLVASHSPGRPACELCGQPLPLPRPAPVRCLPCLGRRSPLDRLFALWLYRKPLDDVVHALKYGDLPYLGRHLGEGLARELPRDLEVDAVVPIPLHWLRGWRRGYNQAAEIGVAVARRREWTFSPLLCRRRRTPPQTGLDRARRQINLERAFALRSSALRGFARDRTGVRRGKALRGRRILLVDDVFTTGSTAEAAARVLKRAGCAWIGIAVAGLTPK